MLPIDPLSDLLLLLLTGAAYLRVSTEDQDEYSLDSQLRLIRDYAAKNGYHIPDEFVFKDETSGRSASKRKDFQRMIALAKDKSHPFSTIFVWKFSRFARNQEESIVYKSMLRRCGVEVVSISEPLADGPFGSLIERILEWMDEFYSIRLSGEVKRGMAEKVSRGEIVTPPALGYDVDSAARRYVPNADAVYVRKIFADYLSGKGVTAIARELRDEGVRSTRGNIIDNRGVMYILQNPVYIGKLRWSKDGHVDYSRSGEKPENGILVDAPHEHLVDAATWDAVQAKLDRTAKGRTKYARRDQPVEWMLKGLVRCDSCGSTLVYSSLACPSMQCYKYSKGQCKTSHSLSIAKANRLVIDALQHCADNLVFPIAPHTVKPQKGPDYAHLIEVEQVKLRRVLEAYESGVDTLDEYAMKKARVNASIEALRAKAEQEKAKADSRSMDPMEMQAKIYSVLELLRSPDASEAAKNAALRSVLSYIVYEKENNRLALYFYS